MLFKNLLLITKIILQAFGALPDLNTIKAIQKIAWSSCTGSLHLVHDSNEEIHRIVEKVYV